MNHNLGGNKVVVSSNAGGLLNFIKSRKKIFVSLLIILSALVIWLMVGLYIKNTFVFEIDGKYYSKKDINNLTQFPRGLDNKTDYYKLAFKYYKYTSVANKLHMYISDADYNSVRNNELNRYNITNNSSNSWIELESKYLTIKNYLDTDSIRAQGKNGFICVFYPTENVSLPNSALLNSIDKYKYIVNYSSQDNYQIGDISGLNSDDIKKLNNSICNNFGFNNSSWPEEVQLPDAIKKIAAKNEKGKSAVYSGYENGSLSYYYYYNLINNVDYPSINSAKFSIELNKVGTTYYVK
jgi:hypothetical protein